METMVGHLSLSNNFTLCERKDGFLTVSDGDRI